jgi:four helix bundle protein
MWRRFAFPLKKPILFERDMNDRKFNLEERLLDFSVGIIRIVEALPKTRVGNHIAGQLIRSGTSPHANHGEAQAAESQKDFIHKLRICLKELRETKRWLELIEKAQLLKKTPKQNEVIQENEELIKIFVASIKTANKNRNN